MRVWVFGVEGFGQQHTTTHNTQTHNHTTTQQQQQQQEGGPALGEEGPNQQHTTTHNNSNNNTKMDWPTVDWDKIGWWLALSPNSWPPPSNLQLRRSSSLSPLSRDANVWPTSVETDFGQSDFGHPYPTDFSNSTLANPTLANVKVLVVCKDFGFSELIVWVF